MNCIIIEDQPPAQRILKKYISDIGTLQLKAAFSDALQAMEFLKSEAIDLIFLDIHLPKISGIDFLKTMSNPPHIILTTAFPDYALESYELDVVDYLLKPFSFQRFVKAVSKISVKTEATIAPSATAFHKELFIKSGYEYLKITISDIIYIQSDADYTELVTKEKKHLSTEPLRYWTENLDKHQFIRIHKSYIVNTSRIIKIAGNQVYMENETVLPIGRTYKDNLIKRFIK